VIKSKI